MSGKYTQELHRAPDDVLSFYEAANEVGGSYLNSQLTYPTIVPVYENRVHYGGTYLKGSMAQRNHS